MLNAAQRLISMGIPVHWLGAPIPGDQSTGKNPVKKGWQTDPMQSLASLASGYEFGYNIGIHCGYVEGADFNLVCLDLDSAESVLWAKDHFPATEVKTKTSGDGEHWFYKHPGKGIRIRCIRIPTREADHIRGDGGQVVCAPSVHNSGAVYTEVTPWTRELLAAMPVFQKAWAPDPELKIITQLHSPNVDKARAEKWAKSVLENVCAEVESAGAGQRNNTLNASCFRLGRLIGGGWLDKTLASRALFTSAKKVGLASGEINKTIASGFQSGALQPHPGPGNEISDQAYIGAAILYHGAAAVSVAAPYIQPSAFLDPQVKETAMLAASMPEASREDLLAEIPGLPAEWDVFGPQTTLEEVRERAARLAKEIPPAIPAAYHSEDPTIPRWPVALDYSLWGETPPPIEPVPITVKLRSSSHVAISEEIITRITHRVGGVEPVYSEGKLWTYNHERSIWEPFTDIESVVQGIDGMPWGEKTYKGQTGPAGYLTLRRSDIDGAIKCVNSILRADGFFDSAMPGISFRNCFVQVSADGVRVLRNHPRNRARFSYEFDYNPDWQCARFGRALGELFAPDVDSQGRKAAILEFLGASLVGIATTYQKALVFTGNPGCGKSVVFEILKSVFPPGSVVAVLPEEMHLQWEKARLAGALLNACDELNGLTIKAVGTMKASITGNLIQGRAVGEQGFDFKPICGSLYSFNRPPMIRDISGGLEDRLLVFRFSRRFRGTPGDNKHLAQDIIAAERPEIVAAAIESAVRLMAQGRYTAVPSAKEALQEWSDQTNPAALYARERLEKIETLSAKWEDVYQDYRKWAEKCGYKQIQTSHNLKAAMVIAGFTLYQHWISARLLP